MSTKIQVRRGLKADLPKLSTGEIGLCTDTEQLYIGTGEKNLEVLSTNSPTMSFKNKIINGNFDIWQRGTSFDFPVTVISEQYSADRFLTRNNEYHGGTTLVTRESIDAGDINAPKNARYFLRYKVINKDVNKIPSTTLNPGATYVATRVENAKTLEGKTATLSFWVKSDITSSCKVVIMQTYNEVDHLLDDQPLFDISPTWRKITHTFKLPKIAEEIVGDRQFLSIAFRTLESMEDSSLDLAQVQLEEGEVATEFEQRPITIEELLCKRYYERRKVERRSSVQQSGFALDRVNFMVPKRKIPTIQHMKLSSANQGNTFLFTSADGAVIALDKIATETGSFDILGASIGVPSDTPVNYGYSFWVEVDAEIY